MNATIIEKPPTPALPSGGKKPTLGILIQTFGVQSSILLASPLGRLLQLALADQSVEPPSIVPTHVGVFSLFVVRDIEASLNILRAEFSALGYCAIAHVGQPLKESEGWRVLY